MSITPAKIDWNETGTPFSTQYDDLYFSNINGLAETQYVFLAQNHLPARWHQCTEPCFVIAETGFGTGLNFLATCQAFLLFRKQNPDSPLKQLHFISVEKFPLTLEDLTQSHQRWPSLEFYSDALVKNYPALSSGCHRLDFFAASIVLELWFMDVKEALPCIDAGKEGLVDAWYLDGFAPSKNPDMWQTTLFCEMARLAKADCTLATFTAAGFVRRGLSVAGFNMQKIKGFANKREMLVGCYSSTS